MHKTLAKMAFVALGITFAAIVHESAFAAAPEAAPAIDMGASTAKGDGGVSLSSKNADGGAFELSAAKGDGGATMLSAAKGDGGAL
jgi:hypothetical protein